MRSDDKIKPNKPYALYIHQFWKALVLPYSLFPVRLKSKAFEFAQTSTNNSQTGLKNSNLSCPFFACEESLTSWACMFGKLHMAYQKIIGDFGYYHFVSVTVQQQIPKNLKLAKHNGHCEI
jgi:hypothetical protein